MIITDKIEDTAVLSSAMQVGEFRIKNSAKAFGILSSGLYANKIRAIVRELSCNAVDSHKAAGKADVPFECHLPNAIEPWFAIRDFGIGLSHDEVINIYTTYFESTKTSSNEFIGALGLGSKSPFSYTENFSVTAIKNGVKGIYSAFINDQGLPSIVKLQEEKTTESPGVEVKFSVNSDFDKFRQEASYVYKFFKTLPNIVGGRVTIEPLKYARKDIAPGISLLNEGRTPIAIMGNIGYPIDVPNKSQLGDLAGWLQYPFVIEFEIGELDIQASREGLSYIPLTIDSIRKRLGVIQDAIAATVEKETAGITNAWLLADKYRDLSKIGLFNTAINAKLAKDNHPLYRSSSNRYGDLFSNIVILSTDMTKWNIRITGLQRNYNGGASTYKAEERTWTNSSYVVNTMIPFSKSIKFVTNNTKVGAQTRLKEQIKKDGSNTIYLILDKIDKTKDMNLVEFFKACYEPPAAMRAVATDYEAPERAARSKTNSYMTLVNSARSGYRHREELVWRALPAANITDYKKCLYIEMKGFIAQKGGKPFSDPHSLWQKFNQVFPGYQLIGSKAEYIADLKAQGAKDFFVELDAKIRDPKCRHLVLAQQAAATYYERDSIHDTFMKFCSIVLPSEVDNKTGKLYNAMVAVSQLRDKRTGEASTHALVGLYREAGLLDDVIKEATLIKKQVNELATPYTMFTLINVDKLDTKHKPALISYINSIGV